MLVYHYVDRKGRDLVQDWLDRLRDPIGRKAVARRFLRLSIGNLGDHKYCREGVWELRIDHGPGYRVYFAKNGVEVILLLCGGDKGSQDRDIARAAGYWMDWKRRS